jgi:hypothetical protein
MIALAARVAGARSCTADDPAKVPKWLAPHSEK